MLEKLEEKINGLYNKEEIFNLTNMLFKEIIDDTKISENDKLLVVDLLNAMVNDRFYKSR